MTTDWVLEQIYNKVQAVILRQFAGLPCLSLTHRLSQLSRRLSGVQAAVLLTKYSPMRSNAAQQRCCIWLVCRCSRMSAWKKRDPVLLWAHVALQWNKVPAVIYGCLSRWLCVHILMVYNNKLMYFDGSGCSLKTIHPPSFFVSTLVVTSYGCGYPSFALWRSCHSFCGYWHCCFMLWKLLCNVWPLLFMVWTYLLIMLIGKLVDAANLWIYHEAEYEFAVLTVVQLGISETLNVVPCSLMGASRRFERLCCLHIKGPKGPRRYRRDGILQCKCVMYSFSVPEFINVFAGCHVMPCAIGLLFPMHKEQAVVAVPGISCFQLFQLLALGARI
jgi:hypothetical protein